jgi:hypothetical protein
MLVFRRIFFLYIINIFFTLLLWFLWRFHSNRSFQFLFSSFVEVIMHLLLLLKWQTLFQKNILRKILILQQVIKKTRCMFHPWLPMTMKIRNLLLLIP